MCVHACQRKSAMIDEGFAPRSRNCLEMSRLQVRFQIWASQVTLVVRNLPASAGDIQDTGSFPGLRSPGEGNGNPLQHCCLKKQITSPDAWDKCSDLVHWEDPEGSGGEGGGRGDQDGEYMYIQGWFMSMYDKNHYNIVKWLASS